MNLNQKILSSKNIKNVQKVESIKKDVIGKTFDLSIMKCIFNKQKNYNISIWW